MGGEVDGYESIIFDYIYAKTQTRAPYSMLIKS